MSELAVQVDTTDFESFKMMTMPEQVQNLASRGLTMKQIAYCLGFGRTKLYRLRESKPDIRDAIEKGRAKGVQIIANSLFNNARDGNALCQIFYLKNRAPDEWHDRKEADIRVDQGNWVINAQPAESIEDWANKHGVSVSEPPQGDIVGK